MPSITTLQAGDAWPQPTARGPKRRKVTFFGNFGQGNLGNEATLEAILYNLRLHSPDVEVNCICTGPEAAALTHRMETIPMHAVPVRRPPRASNRVKRLIHKVFVGAPREACRWVKAFRSLSGTGVLIVPGTQFLSDNLTGPWGWPYLAFKWSLLSKLRRCKLLFVSIGVGPLDHPLSRWFVNWALTLADFRSYRDDLSRQYLRGIGFDATGDPVYPDLAFSLPIAPASRSRDRPGQKLVVALGVKDYHDQYRARLHRRSGDDIYRKYILTMVDVAAWLLQHQYTVRLIIGDTAYDTQVVADVRAGLAGRQLRHEHGRLIHEPIQSVGQLVSQLAESDVIVSPRFHNVVLALVLNRPVIALAYHAKFGAVMPPPHLGKYNLRIEDVTPAKIIGAVSDVLKHADEVTRHIKRNVEELRSALTDQYTRLSCEMNGHPRSPSSCGD